MKILKVTFVALILAVTCLQAQTPPAAAPAEPPATPVATGLRLPSIISDHMVLQREMKTPVWGWSAPDDVITVTAGGVTAQATADSSGKWMARLEGLKASSDPIQVTVAGKSRTITINDVLIGDVWLCSGQSNMVLALSADYSAKEEIPKADYPAIRFFEMTKQKAAIEPQSDCEGHWLVCTPATAAGFSGVGYFFGKEIHEAGHIPVGLISASWGGSIAQAWTSLEGLLASPALSKATRADTYAETRESTMAIIVKHEAWYDAVGKDYALQLRQWGKASQDAKETGVQPPPKPVPSQPEPPNTVLERLPTTLYNGMIAPLVPYGLTGVIWYQGESNRGQGELYRSLFPAMIADWRRHFGQGDFPFIFVQLANYQTNAVPNSIYTFPPVREAQLMTLAASPNTGMAVAIDLGDPADIHAKDKRDVGHRLALVARHLAYGEQLVYSGPLYDSITVEEDKIHVKFKNGGSGLKIGAAPPEQLEKFPATPATTLTGFFIAAADMNFVPATATIEEGDKVVVSSDKVKTPVAVRYDWDDSPAGNLYNNEDLPASPFRTDDWPLSADRDSSSGASRSRTADPASPNARPSASGDNPRAPSDNPRVQTPR